jgi:hypothetical protein
VEEENMTASRKTKLLIWIAMLALIMACVPSLGAPPVPTLDPGAINTAIVQTANAASTQTAAGLPSPTATLTITPTRPTETPSPTATVTVIFTLASPTPMVMPTFTGLSNEEIDENYACQVTRLSPPNGSTFEPREEFGAFWTVKNIGQKNWDRTIVDYSYSGGSKIHKVSGYDLSANVPVGGSIDLVVDLQAPKDPGSYTTTWMMGAGKKDFCRMMLTIIVK